MRLLNVNTLSVEEFLNEDNCPDYAILSHTWGDGEVSFQQLQTDAAKSMGGYRKIEKCCAQAKQGGFEYVWIDTCCIDKTSSAELSEAINSMYRWYQNARICYVFLSDVPSDENPSAEGSKFSLSRWFTRGWTLQELLAPLLVIFYSCDWVEIGTRSSLREEISKITKIPCEVLMSNKPLSEISIAQRMSWAAMRQTTKIEDTAYSLLGIFDVNVPTLYGEGWKAFIRLQEEIIKNSEDESLFAWMDPSFQPFSPDKWFDEHANNRDNVVKAITDAKSSTRYRISGLLARSPADFRHSNVVRSEDVPGGQYPFSMTNNGLNIKLPLARVRGTDIYQATLNCYTVDQNYPVVIYLKKESRKDRGRLYLTGQGELSEQYTRFVVNDARYATNVERTPEDIYVKAVYLPPQTELSTFRQNSSRYVFHLSITLSASTEPRYLVLEAYYNPKFIEFDPPVHGRQALNALPDESFVAALRLGYEDRPTDQSIIVVGREQSKSNLWCTVLDYSPQSPTLSTLLKELTQSPTWTNLQSDPRKFDEAVVQLTLGYIISASIRPGARSQSAKTVAPPAQVILDHQHLIVKVTTPATQDVDPSPVNKKSTWFGLRA